MIRIKKSQNKTLSQLLGEAGYALPLPCGGMGKCGKCRVKAWGEFISLSGEKCRFDGEEILSCSWIPLGEVSAELPSLRENEIVKTDTLQLSGGAQGIGAAVDIGTTTLAVYLYDLSSGKCVFQYGAMNTQQRFGADVISRIQHCGTPGGLEEMSACIRQQIYSALESSGQNISDIKYISIAGNTVMQHIFAGLSPESIGVSPFTPLSLFGEEHSANEFWTEFSESCKVYLAPAVAGYVGGDITAGLAASGAFDREDTVFFLDIGTNGEMALGNKKGFICCATAAGPAFEGAETDCGSPAQDGAINTVRDDLSFTVLGETEPSSICGSGIIDAISALLKSGIIDETGYLEDDRYHFTDKVYISAGDVRKIQLAKAAIRAGIDTLLEEAGMCYNDVSEVLIAGGFGAYMNVESACSIGLLPKEFAAKARHVGNSAGKGAALALYESGRDGMRRAAENCRYVELSSSASFMEKYVEAMMFDE